MHHHLPFCLLQELHSVRLSQIYLSLSAICCWVINYIGTATLPGAAAPLFLICLSVLSFSQCVLLHLRCFYNTISRTGPRVFSYSKYIGCAKKWGFRERMKIDRFHAWLRYIGFYLLFLIFFLKQRILIIYQHLSFKKKSDLSMKEYSCAQYSGKQQPHVMKLVCQ